MGTRIGLRLLRGVRRVMSAALQSLMRSLDAPRPAARDPRGLFSFVLIGGAGAVAFVLLSQAGLALWPRGGSWISALSYGLLIGPVYLLHRRFSFRSGAAHRQALPRYVAVQALALVLAALFGFALHGVLALPGLVASMLVIGLTSGINFVVLRAWAFRGAPHGGRDGVSMAAQ